MSGYMVAFFILAIIAIMGGVLMMTLEKVIHMVVALVFTFLSIAGIYVLLSAEFVAVVQILIYSGGVSIIMLFGIMLTKHDARAQLPASRLRYALAAIGVLAFFIVMFYGINHLNLGHADHTLENHNTEKIGVSLYSVYIIPFEITSMLLLVALIGAITLAKRDGDTELSEDE